MSERYFEEDYPIFKSINLDDSAGLCEYEQMLFEAYAVQAEWAISGSREENFKSYDYIKKDSNLWVFNDICKNTLFVYTFLNNDCLEIRQGWMFDDYKIYDPPFSKNKTYKDWQERINTFVAIYKNEIITIILNNSEIKCGKLISNSIVDYQLHIRVAKNLTPLDKFEIIENKPKEVILKKKIK